MRTMKVEADANSFLDRQAIQFQQFSCFQWLLHFSVFQHVPLTGSVPYTTLAAASGTPIAQLKSIARMAMTGGILHETDSGEVAHSTASRQFVTEPKLLARALYMTSASAPTAAKMTQQTSRFGTTVAKNQTAYNLAFDTPLSFFEHTGQSKERSQQFATYMQSVTASPSMDLRHLVEGYDWQALGEATIVDVGGSTGHASIALADRFPLLAFTVQDLASTLSGRDTAAVPAHLRPRITFQPHDFFTPEPIVTADVYLLRMILHDWPMERAQAILGHLAAALKPGARILIMDTVLPTPGSADAHDEALLRVRDLTMLQSFNAREREWEDWRTLIAGVEPPLQVKSWTIPKGSAMGIIELVKA